MPRLPPEWTALFGAGVSHRIGSCDAGGRPTICRALATDELPDGRIVCLTGRHASHELLDAIAATAQVALTMSLPSTHRTLHLKGRDAAVLPPEPGDETLLAQRCEAFAKVLEPFGFEHGMLARRWYRVPAGDLRRVVFSVHGAWNQSPGPGAGQAIELLP